MNHDLTLNRADKSGLMELERARRVIEQFLYSCSHSLRSPLSSAVGLTTLLKMSGQFSDKESAALFVALDDSLKKMNNIVSDMGEFLHNSQKGIHATAISIGDITRKVLEEFKSHRNADLVELRILNYDETPIYIDAERTTIVLRQLISNSYQYVDLHKKHHTIVIETEATDLRARVKITDNGIGIPDEATPHLFELFYRGTPQSTGTGIGLYIVKDILDKIGGTITIESCEGIGTTVGVSIPNGQFF